MFAISDVSGEFRGFGRTNVRLWRSGGAFVGKKWRTHVCNLMMWRGGIREMANVCFASVRRGGRCGGRGSVGWGFGVWAVWRCGFWDISKKILV